MRRPRPRPFSRARNEEGFTFLEVLVGLVILSFLGAALAGSVSAALRTALRIDASLRRSSRMLRIDDTLRSLAARVRTPYWAASHAVSTVEGELRVGWLDGDPDRRLSIGFHDGVLTIGDGESASRFDGIDGALFSLTEDEESRVSCLRLELDFGGSRELTIVARLGGEPLRERREP